MPSTPDPNETGFSITDSQLGELFYNELGGTAHNRIPNNALFSNEQNNVYWSGTEYTPSPVWAEYYDVRVGFQGGYGKVTQFYAWPISSGNVTAAVPVPSSIWLFVSGAIGLLSFRPRGNISVKKGSL